MRDALERLRGWQNEHGHSVTKMAKLLGCSRPMMSLILNGQRRPGLVLAVRIERLTRHAIRCADWVVAEERDAA